MKRFLFTLFRVPKEDILIYDYIIDRLNNGQIPLESINPHRYIVINDNMKALFSGDIFDNQHNDIKINWLITYFISSKFRNIFKKIDAENKRIKKRNLINTIQDV